MNKTNVIRRMIEKFDQLSILIIGDVMVDSYIIGRALRISPEAPVPVVNMEEEEHRLGGAANVALNIKSMGATPILCSIIGTDSSGDEFLKILTGQNGMSAEGILRNEERKTTVKRRIVSHGQQLLRIDSESIDHIDKKTEDLLLNRIKAILTTTKIDAIIFEDYDKGVITGNIINETSLLAKKKNIPTLADPKKKNFLKYKDITLLKPNLKEFYEGIGEEISWNLETLTKKCFEFKLKQNIAILMITLSEKGIFVYGEDVLHFPTQVKLVADVSGAGDTVISVASLCLAANIDLETTIKLSNLAGGQVCEKAGVVPVDKDNLIARYIELNEKNDLDNE